MTNLKIEVRNAVLDDLPNIIRLLADDDIGAVREDTNPSHFIQYQQAFSAIQNDTKSEVLVALINDEVIGCVQLTIIPGLSYQGGSRCQIEDLRVMRERRGSGIGHILMENVQQRAEDMGCKLIQLMVHRDRDHARRFYQHCGFESFHDGFRKKISG
jgi:ribosomal protein S18 acetylase RimI-like enzyme